MTNDAFNKRNELMTKSWSITLKRKKVKTLVWSAVLYGAETWTLRKDERRMLDAHYHALKMWIWRRMKKMA